MLARWLSTISASAASRSESVQLAAPTYTTFAFGATPCTSSTSSDSSPYQPAASHSYGAVSCQVLDRTWVYWPGANGLSPVAWAYSFASDSMVGDA